MIPTFPLLLKWIETWERKELKAFEYEDSDEHGVVKRRREPSQYLRSWGDIFAKGLENDKIRLLYWSSTEPKKHIFIFIRKDFWKFGTVTFAWIGRRALGTWQWDMGTRTLKPSMPENTQMAKAVSEVESCLSCYPK